MAIRSSDVQRQKNQVRDRQRLHLSHSPRHGGGRQCHVVVDSQGGAAVVRGGRVPAPRQRGRYTATADGTRSTVCVPRQSPDGQEAGPQVVRRNPEPPSGGLPEGRQEDAARQLLADQPSDQGPTVAGALPATRVRKQQKHARGILLGSCTTIVWVYW